MLLFTGVSASTDNGVLIIMISAITDTKKVVKVLLINNYIGLSLVMITASLSFYFNMEEIIFFC